ncbi:MAG: DUF4253 domain-containing protein [Desulfovibrio sp.]|nr:MAG: DUF4253 domain-containing protein [Desulfovibrio sp.]
MGFFNKLFRNSSTTPPQPPDFPFPLVTVRGREAEAALAELQAQGKDQGFCPVLLGGDSDVQRITDFGSYVEQDVEELLARAKDIDPKAWFEDIRKQDPDYYASELGEWPKRDRPVSGLTTHRKVLSGLCKPWVHIVQVPTEKSWEVPCYLKLGDWNDCPAPPVHTALAKYWRDKYGAEIVGSTGETIEFTVESPPDTREAAEALAMEHFLYCPDAVHQGAESIRNLGAMVIGASVWTFWWD